MQGKVYQVATQKELTGALGKARAGDTVQLRSGVWDSVAFSLSLQATEKAPLIIKGASDGSTVITGRSCLEVGGRFITLSHLNFFGVEPPDEKSSIIYFQKGSSDLAYKCRLSHCVFESCNPKNPERRYSWVRVTGDQNRIDHNRFIGQDHSGVTVQVKLAESEGRHRIDHNHFYNRRPGDGNGFECIQIGQSKDSERDSYCLVENNLFQKCDGEIEIVSSKTGRNIFRENTFLDSAGTLTLRHGNHSLVEQNIFIGRGKARTGGIRIIGTGHRIRNNYLNGLAGRNGGTIVLYSGIPDSPLNGYFAAHDTIIENNCLVNCSEVGLVLRGGYGERGRTIVPKNVSVKRNVIHLLSTDELAIEGSLPDIILKDNLTNSRQRYTENSGEGFSVVEMQLIKSSEDLYMPVDADGHPLFAFDGNSPTIMKTRNTGPDWQISGSKNE